MPKINVYLPDDLAEAVKEAGIPVSAVCQRALEQAVRRVTAIRETVLGDLTAEPTGAMAHFTARTRTVLKQAAEADAPRIGTDNLLSAMLTEGTNLSLHVLRAMEIDPARVLSDLSSRPPEEHLETDRGPFNNPAANALELAVTEAIALGHNYIGCEHLLLGLSAEPDGVAGQVLRSLGADPKLVRRAVTAALAGYVHLRAESQPAPQALATALRTELEPLTQRITRLEEHLGLNRS